MKSKTILGADGATKMRQITVGIHGKGGEAGIKAIQQLAGMVDSLKQCQTPQEVYDRYLQITGYCKCCVDCNFIDQKGADELMCLAAYSVINNLTGGKLESIRSTISNKIQAAKDTVSSVLDSIKSAFSSKLEAARSVVSSTIEKIKGVFNFSWKLPDLKLPHISVNGGQAPYGIGGKGSLPSFSIQWYKEGGILNGATIFGAMGGNLLGGGEAGAEAVLPLSELWKQMTEIVKGVVKGENEESGDTVQQTGANITSALTSKAASVRKEKESKTTTTKETYTSERWGKEGGTTIHQISFTVDISKIKDLPLLYKLIDELKDAQNRTDSPTPATT